MDIVELGVIYKQQPAVEGDEPVFVALNGWHIDSLQPIAGAESFLVTVNTPAHEFAGVDSAAVYRYRFDSKAQAAGFMPVQEVAE